MAKITIQEIINFFPFLDDRSAQEPYLYPILLEIQSSQKKMQSGKSNHLITREEIYNSRNIKMPFTPTREKNIDYILELLTERFGDHISNICSFNFGFDEKAKKLIIKENDEFALDIAPDAIQKLQEDRTDKSVENLLSLLGRFRVFNLTKLLAKCKNKKELSRIIKLVLGKTIFTYKNYSLSKQRLEKAEDYCFHIKNYDNIKKSLNNDMLSEIVTTHMDMLKRRLENYGIYNAHFTDYRDKKVDYILHILMEDISDTLSILDQINIKNYHSLRNCIMKVDKVLDPARIYGNDIAKFIRETQYTTATDILANITDIDQDILNKWANDSVLANESIIKFVDKNNNSYFLNGKAFIDSIEQLYQLLRYSPEKLAAMTSSQKKAVEFKMNIYYLSAKKVIQNSNVYKILDAEKTDIENLKNLIEHYEQYLTELNMRSSPGSPEEETEYKDKKKKKKKSFIAVIMSFISGLFSRQSKSSTATKDRSPSTIKTELSRETKQIFAKATTRKGPIIPLSEFIEINRENDPIIDKLIDDMRSNNMKIVIPIYNARRVLYPKRSAKVLIADIEYLLAPMNVITSQESITSYIDSLVGYKIKDDIIGGSALIAIEKYLRTLYRQKKSIMVNKEKAKKLNNKNT